MCQAHGLVVSGAVALPMAFALAVVALDPTLKMGRLGRSGNTLAILLGLSPSTAGLLAGLLKVCRLVDHQHGGLATG